jgi:hypothetical protein
MYEESAIMESSEANAKPVYIPIHIYIHTCILYI